MFKTALALAAVLWMASVAFVIEPLLVHSALLGRGDAWHTHRFALSSGWAKPISPDAAHIPPIELPGAQSRLAWIKPGSEADLATVQAPDPYWDAYRNSGDAVQLGRVWADMMRAANGPSFAAALDPGRDRGTVLDAVTETLAARIAADPQQNRSFNVIVVIEADGAA